jgi:ADP-heptose:LPS heptosyltransferase
LDWGSRHLGESRLEEAEECVRLGFSLHGRTFPDLYPRLVLLQASILSERGEASQAYDLLRELHLRRDLVSDRRLVPEIVLGLARLSLLTGRVREFRGILFDGLRTFYPGLSERAAVASGLSRVSRGGARLLLGNAGAADKLIFGIHWLYFWGRRGLGPLQRLSDRVFLGGVYAAQYVLSSGPSVPRGGPRIAARPEGVLVSRAMGGIGDLLMMTPGLRALGERRGAPVDLAVPRRYFPLFEGNDDVRLVDIHGSLDPTRYEKWYNLTDCPAARVESLTAPSVRRNRIEIFARALGVRRSALRRVGRRPRYFVTNEERMARERFLRSCRAIGRPLVGVQLNPEESYRRFDDMPALVRELAAEYSVLLFDGQPVEGYELEHVVKVDRHSLREAFAIAEACDVIVAPDSALFHLAAAFEIPGVGLFGPTDGRVRGMDYPLAEVLDARGDLRCVPCWRNEDIACALTGMRRSVCMGSIGVPWVRAAVRRALDRRRESRGQTAGY